MNHVSRLRTLGLAAVASALPAAAQFTFSEDFATSPSALTLNAGSSQTTFNDAGGNLLVAMTGGFEASSAFITQTWADNDFTVSAFLAPSAMLFTNGWGGVYAYGDDQFDSNGYTARVANIGFSIDDYRLEIVSFGTVVAQSAVFDLVQGFEDAYTTLQLDLVGSFSGADLTLTATLTPFFNPNSLPVISTGPVTIVNASLVGEQWGIRQTKAGNTLNIAYDDFAITVVPEPGAFALLLGLAGLGVAARRLRR